MKQLEKEIDTYWTNQAEGYSNVNKVELNGVQKVNMNINTIHVQISTKWKKSLLIFLLVQK